MPLHEYDLLKSSVPTFSDGYKGGKVTKNGTILECLVNSNPEQNVYWLEINYAEEYSTEVRRVVSNVTVLDVCQVESFYRWTQSDEPGSGNFTFRCVTFVDDEVFLNGEEVFELTFTNLTEEELCPMTTTMAGTGKKQRFLPA
jgi:hypothetical protein